MPRTKPASGARTRSSPQRQSGRPAAPAATALPAAVARKKNPSRSKASAATPAERTQPEITLRQLAHELNSLLDGSMRCLGMARTSLGEGGGERRSSDSIDDGLGKALAAMKHMAALLDRALRLTAGPEAPSSVALFHSDHSLEAALAEITRMVQPYAHAQGVTLETAMSPGCANMPAGPVGVVLLNGLRNAIESCAANSNSQPRRVRCHIDACDNKDSLCIAIEDTGTGGAREGQGPHRADSHGVGLTLSQQIVRELGGELALLIGPNGEGATLRVSIPVRSLIAHD